MNISMESVTEAYKLLRKLNLIVRAQKAPWSAEIGNLEFASIYQNLYGFYEPYEIFNISGLEIGERSTFWGTTSDGQELTRKDLLDAETFEKLGNASKYGRGLETVLDTSYRSSREISYQTFTPKPDLYAALFKHIEKSMFFGSYKLEFKFHKIVRYNRGDFFMPHRDTQYDDNHVGTLIVCLSNETNSDLYLCDQPIELDSFKCVAFYTDCIHEVKPCQNPRVIVQYNVFRKQHLDDELATADQTNNNSYIFNKDDELEYKLPGKMYTSDTFSNLKFKRRSNDPNDVQYRYRDLSPETDDEKIPDVAFDHIERRMFDSYVQALSEFIRRAKAKSVAFPLRHLYSQANMRIDRLKGVDALVAPKLAEIFGGRVQVVQTIVECERTVENDSKKDSLRFFNKDEEPTCVYMASTNTARELATSCSELHAHGNEGAGATLQFIYHVAFLKVTKD